MVISNTLSSFPYVAMLSICSGTIMYYMVGFHAGISRHVYFCLNLFLCISIVETCMMIVALIVPNLLMGIGVGTSLLVSSFNQEDCYYFDLWLIRGYVLYMQIVLMMASETFKIASDLPNFFWRYPMSYISFASWAIQVQFSWYIRIGWLLTFHFWKLL